MFKKYFSCLLLLFICSVTFAETSYSQSNTNQDTAILRTKKRLAILNGFRFMPSNVVKDPFVNTYIQVNVGSGTAFDLESYVKNFNGNIIDTLSGDLAYVTGLVEFQYAVNDWLSFMGNYKGMGRLGKNTYTILTQGVSYTTGYSLAGKARLLNKEKFTLSGGLVFSSDQIYVYSLYDYIKRRLENPGDSTLTDDLLVKDNVYKLFMEFNAAYAPYNWLGILGTTGFGIGKAFEQKERGNIRIGAAASVDFLNVKGIKFPVGLLGSAKYNAFSENGENVDNVFTLGFQIGYTGHKDFDIGIEATYQNLNFRKDDNKIKTIRYDAKLKYYF